MEKLEKLRELLDEQHIDGLLVTNGYNRRYLTGFTGTAGAVLVSRQGAVLVTDFRYVEQASRQAQGFEVVQHSGPIIEEIANQVKRLGIKRLGFEQEHVTYAAYKSYEEAIRAELVPTSWLVEKLRLIKSEAEIKILKEAAEIADAAFSHILSFIRPGVKEIEVANELEFLCANKGRLRPPLIRSLPPATVRRCRTGWRQRKRSSAASSSRLISGLTIKGIVPTLRERSPSATLAWSCGRSMTSFLKRSNAA